jgi:glucosylceramidase
LALDENDGPKNFGCQNCWGVVRVTSDGRIEKNAEFYAIGHYGKVVQPGAVRLVSNQDILKGVAFRNPDNSFAYLAVYYGTTPQTIGIQCGNSSFVYTFKPGEVVSFLW